MTFASTFVLSGLLVMIVMLVKEALRPGIILFVFMTFCMIAGIISVDEALEGFSNKGMLTVLVLFFVSEGVRQTGALNVLSGVLLPKKQKSLPLMLLRMMIPVTALSAALNNTPVVLIFAPMIKKWAEKLKVPASKFLIPLSYATIFGGVSTLIGTSTNLVVHGLMLDNGFEGLGMFELFKVGGFIIVAGLIYVSLLAPLLLPGKKQKDNNYLLEQKKYYYNVYIPDNSQFIGKCVSHGHFPENRDIFVTMIERDGESIDVSGGDTELMANDKLVIWGYEHVLEQLVSMPGIHIEDYENIDLWFREKELKTIEVVVSDSFPGIGQTLREFNFYNTYRGVVAAIQRNGEKITTHTGDVSLKAGDCLMILATPSFMERWNGRRDFYLVSEKGKIEMPQARPRIYIAMTLVIIMVVGASFSDILPTVGGNRIDMFFLAASVAAIMFITNLISPKNYTHAVNWDVILTIVSAFGISKAVQNSGLADTIAYTLINSVKSFGPVAILAVIYLVTTLFTEIITNNAAVALMFPISMAVAEQLNVHPQPFFIAICVAASASFSTPIGYQTNLIVQGIGEYKFRDFLRIGLPLNIIVMIISLLIIPLFWPL